jgi:fido (protein-threonine AMPylation protein)
MFIHEIVGQEADPTYQRLSIENLDRQYGFLRSVAVASLGLGRPLLSLEVLLALNYHAIACLHAYAGELRPCPVFVGQRQCPQHFQVPALMHMFIDEVNRNWDATDPISLATYVLWRINYIHPFVNGNGRTARAACYYVLCLKANGWLAGEPILPELIRANRPAYVAALQHAHTTFESGKLDLSLLQALISQLVTQQIASAERAAPTAANVDGTQTSAAKPPPAASSPSTGG